MHCFLPSPERSDRSRRSACVSRRTDTVAKVGKVSLRYGNRMLHLGVGRGNARTDIIVVGNNFDATVMSTTGAMLGEYKIDATQSYQPKLKNG